VHCAVYSCYFAPPSSPPRRGAKYCHVCLSTHITRKPRGQTSQFFVRVVCGCGLDLWWRCDTLCSTSCFIDDVMFSYHGISGSESSMMLCLQEVCQVAVPVGRQTTTVFGWVCQNEAAGVKSVIRDCLVYNAEHSCFNDIIRLSDWIIWQMLCIDYCNLNVLLPNACWFIV